MAFTEFGHIGDPNYFDRIIFFDTETTGLDFVNDRIVEICAMVYYSDRKAGSFSRLIKLPEGIVNGGVAVNHITKEMLDEKGVSEYDAMVDFGSLFGMSTLLVAYNAQFDLNFLLQALYRTGLSIGGNINYLDPCTIAKDRKVYPHKLVSLIDHYNLGGTVVNSHRALDDVRAMVEVVKKMVRERDDLANYINLFGVHPKYGMSGMAIPGITYRLHQYNNIGLLPMENCLYSIGG